MKVNAETRTIELTRRNLRALLVKLDLPESARTIYKDGWYVTFVEDEAHYADRAPGRMSDETEALL